ncbi:MAG: DEAD/DEAH box helicase [Cyclobacteriaceae bacterium]|nr:MAG: DEAD/DEAH box helicase [Cyclobacteriaceae bacterium]
MIVESTSFKDFKLNKQLLEAITQAGYTNPTPIQIKAIPLISAGHDLMGIAQTGTGKTAAFILPLLMKVKYAQGLMPRALILAPTRELVLQLHQEVVKLSAFTDLRSLAVFGGIGPKSQIEAIERGVDLVIATPGRFLDLYLRGDLKVKALNTLVLDEADKMMDMGFMPQIRRILEVIPVKRQNLLFSATMPDEVLQLSQEFLEFPEIIEASPSATPAVTVTQYAYQLPNFKTKVNLLHHLLKDVETFCKVIVFVKTKKVADNIYKYLVRSTEGEIRVIHSNKGQNARMNSLSAFKNDEVRVLVSTDVGSRGIDVTMVSHVINFDVPLVYEDYVHRIGRTGRAENFGVAITFFNPAEVYHIAKIEQLTGQKIDKRTIPPEVVIESTSRDEQQLLDRAIDRQKQLDDPNYLGAFHRKSGKRTSKGISRQKRR